MNSAVTPEQELADEIVFHKAIPCACGAIGAHTQLAKDLSLPASAGS